MNGHRVVQQESGRFLSAIKQLASILWSPKWITRVGLQVMDEIVPSLCIALGMVWLAYIVLSSAATPGVLLCFLGVALWTRRECRVLRDRGGPIALLPPWARTLLLETRPLDAMSAVAVVIDAQKGIGMLVHLLAALRLDAKERSGFAEQLPPRIRDLVLAPGLLHILPKSVKNYMSWGTKNTQQNQIVSKPKRKLIDAQEAGGDAPRADDLLVLTEDLVNRTRRSHSENGLEYQKRGGKRRKTKNGHFTTLRKKNQQQFFPVPEESDEDESQPINANKSWWPFQSARRRMRSLKSTSFKSQSSTVARVVAEFNPWPTLYRVIQRRATGWLRQQISIRALASTAVASATCMGLQLTLSPASRRVAANTARLATIITATSAFIASGTAFVTLHLHTLLEALAESQTFSPRNAKSEHRTAARARLLSLRSQHSFSQENNDDDLTSVDTPFSAKKTNEKYLKKSPGTKALSVFVGGYILLRVCDRAALFAHFSPFASQLAQRITQVLIRLRRGTFS
mmetsp:Transcript_5466/g.8065  ORF Transcript_5466/g.8065 Transcript_5466/m.8065 type:complete len:513 (+) Transcript_5466:35-1573(+)